MDSTHHSRNGFLTRRGYAEVAQQTSLEGLASRDVLEYVDRVGSVSALDGDGDLFVDVPDALIDQQYRRFLNGS